MYQWYPTQLSDFVEPRNGFQPRRASDKFERFFSIMEDEDEWVSLKQWKCKTKWLKRPHKILGSKTPLSKWLQSCIYSSFVFICSYLEKWLIIPL